MTTIQNQPAFCGTPTLKVVAHKNKKGEWKLETPEQATMRRSFEKLQQAALAAAEQQKQLASKQAGKKGRSKHTPQKDSQYKEKPKKLDQKA